MTNQEIFDTVTAHLWSMKERSMLNGTCAYRGKNGSKCAVGILIPDDIYKSEMEGLGVYGLFCVKEWRIFKEDQITLLRNLQRIHDANVNWGKNGLYVKVNRKFAALAKEHNLTYTSFKRSKA